MARPHTVMNQLNLVVRDMQASLAFYRRLGAEIPEDAARRSSHHSELSMPGDFTLELDSVELAKAYNASSRGPLAGGAVLGFAVPSREDVDRLHAALVDAGDASCQPPYDTFWGARYAIVADPDGNQVGLMSPIDPTRRRAPPNLS